MRFWHLTQAWCIGQVTDAEFVREQRLLLGFIWLLPAQELVA